MVIILVVLTVGFFIAVEIFRRSRRQGEGKHQPLEQPARASTEKGENYLHPGHSWVRVLNPRKAIIGVDELAQSFIGRVDGISIPQVGRKVRQGEPLVTLQRGKRAITIVSPLSGVLWDVNYRLREDPTLVNSSPLARGWIACMEPESLELESRNLLKGTLAERWKEGVLAQIQAWYAPGLGTVLQDGGSPAGNLGENLTDDAWESLARILFPLHSSGNKNKPSQGIMQ